MVKKNVEKPALLTRTEVGELFRVDPQTVTRWALARKLTCIRTLGGHRRYDAKQVHKLLGTEESLLTPAEVAKAFRVNPKTVARWAIAGKLNFIRTLGGHRRYFERQIRELLVAS